MTVNGQNFLLWVHVCLHLPVRALFILQAAICCTLCYETVRVCVLCMFQVVMFPSDFILDKIKEEFFTRMGNKSSCMLFEEKGDATLKYESPATIYNVSSPAKMLLYKVVNVFLCKVEQGFTHVSLEFHPPGLSLSSTSHTQSPSCGGYWLEFNFNCSVFEAITYLSSLNLFESTLDFPKCPIPDGKQ